MVCVSVVIIYIVAMQVHAFALYPTNESKEICCDTPHEDILYSPM